MQIGRDLIENIGEDEIKKFFKKKGIYNKNETNFQNWIAGLDNSKISKEEFEEYCYDALMYGKRKLIHSYLIKNTRVLKDENKWILKLKKEFSIPSLNFNDVLSIYIQPGDEWNIVAIKSEDDEKGDLSKISILFQCYVCKKDEKSDSCTYIPLEIDLKNGVMLIKSWRRLGLENEEEYKYNYLMDKVFAWVNTNMELEIKVSQLGYKKTLSNMNGSLIEELLSAIPTSHELALMKEYYPRIEAMILSNISFENKYKEDGQDKLPENVMRIQNELDNLITRAIVSDYFFKREYKTVWDMNLSAIVNSVKLSELDNSITIVKSENNNKPVFCGKPFLMLLGAMENSEQVDSLVVSFMHRDKRFRVSYDATNADYVAIGILSGQDDFCANDYQVIWEMLKRYEKGKVKPIEKLVDKAIGE